jgi:hypothetical protein
VSPQTRVAEIVTFISERINQNETSGCNITTVDASGRSESDAFLLFPNPAQEVLQIKNLNHVMLESLSISDALGRKIIQISWPDHDRVDISALKNGLYFLEIKTNHGLSIHRFLVSR